MSTNLIDEMGGPASSKALFQEMVQRSLYSNMTCFYCSCFVFIIVALKHTKWRGSEVCVSPSLHSALVMSPLITELTEEDVVDAICSSEQVFPESGGCWSRKAKPVAVVGAGSSHTKIKAKVIRMAQVSNLRDAGKD